VSALKLRLTCLEAESGDGWLIAVYFTWKVTVLLAWFAREMTNL
jgi:hypothetical protein